MYLMTRYLTTDQNLSSGQFFTLQSNLTADDLLGEPFILLTANWSDFEQQHADMLDKYSGFVVVFSPEYHFHKKASSLWCLECPPELSAQLELLAPLLADMLNAVYTTALKLAECQTSLRRFQTTAEDLETRLERKEKGGGKSSHSAHFQNLSATMALSLDGILMADRVGNILYINEAWAQIHQYQVEELTGANIRRFHTEKQLEEELTPFIQKARMATNKQHAGNIGHKKKNGKTVTCWMSVSLLRDDDGNETGMVAVLRDMTKQRMINQELNEYHQRLGELSMQRMQRVSDEYETSDTERTPSSEKELTETKTILLENSSYELRTSMNAIMGLSTLLLEGSLDVEQKRFIENIYESGKSLMGTINDILDISKIEKEQLTLELHPFDLEKSVSSALGVAALLAQQKKLEIVSDIDPQIENLILLGDELRISQILINLLSNAVKYTDQGKITLILQQRYTDESCVCVDISVSDTGKGIPKEYVEWLQSPFIKEDLAHARRYGGRGFGLPICKKLCELMNSKLRVQTDAGRGTTFTLTVLFKRAEEISMEATESSGDQSLANNINIKILLAEDDRSNQLVMTAVLGHLGYYYLDVVANGQEVLDALDKVAYDVVIMDILMPEIDGIEATRRIREKYGKKPWIIGMTAQVLSEYEERGMEAGMNDYMTKPAEAEMIKAALQRVPV